jgi:uncharacterized protein DUF4238
MTAHQKPKRRHHHVWQKYLKPWTTNGAIWCLQDRRIFPSSTLKIAVEKDFYKLHKFTREDIALIKMLSDGGHPLAQRDYDQLLNRLMLPFQMAEQVKAPLDRVLIDQLVDYHASEALEQYHSVIEASFIPSLESALNGDISFYSDDERCIDFLHYLCTQYWRTKGIKERAIERCNADKSADLSRVWNVLVLKLAFDLGLTLYRQHVRRKLFLVHNYTDMPFITGDQPAINLKGARPHPPENLSIYYPISPQLALLLADVDEEPLFATEGLTAAQASMLNGKLFEACYKQAFAQSEESLKALLGPGTVAPGDGSGWCPAN